MPSEPEFSLGALELAPKIWEDTTPLSLENQESIPALAANEALALTEWTLSTLDADLPNLAPIEPINEEIGDQSLAASSDDVGEPLQPDSLDLDTNTALGDDPNFFPMMTSARVAPAIDMLGDRPGAVRAPTMGDHAEVQPTLSPLVSASSQIDDSAALEVASIDKNIDEALDLAERVRAPKMYHDIDDLEVPAFLRQGMRDLPLD